ncbi:MAG: trehalose-phosphatase [Chloroflexi bacterium]|nr:trehalose-phosphatase [Chloroflexota bacterium]
MKPLLLSLMELQRELPERLALLVDIDGTISPIAPTPDMARVDSACRRALAALAAALPLVAAVSGRSAADAASITGITNMVYVGNHGLERWQGGQLRPDPRAADLAWAVNAACSKLRGRLMLPGVLYEHKGLTVSVHYRLSPDPDMARQIILDAVQDTAPALPIQVREGRRVVEIWPALSVDKGTAIEGLLGEYQPEGALYLGDDRTDVDAFRALHRWTCQKNGWGAAIAVANPETPREVLEEADYRLDGIADVRRFLSWLAQIYSAGNALPPRSALAL